MALMIPATLSAADDSPPLVDTTSSSHSTEASIATSEIKSTPRALENEPLYAAPTRHDRIGRILAPVMINGSGPYRFIVDTGATHSTITPGLAASLSLPATVDPIIVIGTTGSASMAAVTAESLTAGDVVRENIALPLLSSVMAGADGLLGVEGLEDKRLTIQFRKDRITISDSAGQRAPPGYLTVPVKLRFGRLMMADATLGRVKVQVVIDTGAAHSVGNNALRDALTHNRSLGRWLGLVAVEGVTSEIQVGELIRTPAITLGNVTINDIALAFGEFHIFELWGLQSTPAIVFGMDVLGTVDTLIIDYRRRELQLLPTLARLRM